MGLFRKLFGPPDVPALLARKDVSGLADATTDNDESIRVAAIDGLSMIATMALNATNGVDTQSTMNALMRNIAAGPAGMQPLPGDQESATARAATAPLIDAASARAVRVRLAAAQALARICASKGVKWLAFKEKELPAALQSLSVDESVEVRRSALVAFAFLARNVHPPNPLYGPFIKALAARLNDNDELTRHIAIWTLGGFFRVYPVKPGAEQAFVTAAAETERARAASGVRGPLSDVLIAFHQCPDGIHPRIGAQSAVVRDAGEKFNSSAASKQCSTPTPALRSCAPSPALRGISKSCGTGSGIGAASWRDADSSRCCSTKLSPVPPERGCDRSGGRARNRVTPSDVGRAPGGRRPQCKPGGRRASRDRLHRGRCMRTSGANAGPSRGCTKTRLCTVLYSRLESPPRPLRSGYAGLLCLFDAVGIGPGTATSQAASPLPRLGGAGGRSCTVRCRCTKTGLAAPGRPRRRALTGEPPLFHLLSEPHAIVRLEE
jgi:hypothetical protein